VYTLPATAWKGNRIAAALATSHVRYPFRALRYVDHMGLLDSLSRLLQVSGSLGRILAIVTLAVGSHLTVILIHYLSRLGSRRADGKTSAKWRSIATLSTSILVFAIYAWAIGLILRELGISLKAYVAGASVIGLAVGFGSQGIVQDVLTGLTLVFSDLVDVGDMVEISGQTGIVEAITMRFVVLRNPLGAKVFIPNRTITNVINYPKGYVRCIVDILLTGDDETGNKIEVAVHDMMRSASEQFTGILVAPPSVEGRVRTGTSREFIRVKFRIWPGRGGPIETTFRQELFRRIEKIDPAYSDWMVSVAYEVEKTVKARR
jgi:small-conductance mechanosensitive channel